MTKLDAVNLLVIALNVVQAGGSSFGDFRVLETARSTSASKH